jgi:hypothetical protein
MSIQHTVAAALAAASVAGSLNPAALADDPRSTQPSNGRAVIEAPDGFNWGDAAIGAGAGVGTAVAALGAVTLARNK